MIGPQCIARGLFRDCEIFVNLHLKPYCEGFNWREGRRSGFSSIEGKAWEDPACPLQTLASPASAPPTSWYMKHYAGHQEAWLTDFAAAYDKMSSNGYGAGSLALVEAALEATECTGQLELDYSQCWARGDGAGAAQVRVKTQVGEGEGACRRDFSKSK